MGWPRILRRQRVIRTWRLPLRVLIGKRRILLGRRFLWRLQPRRLLRRRLLGMSRALLLGGGPAPGNGRRTVLCSRRTRFLLKSVATWSIGPRPNGRMTGGPRSSSPSRRRRRKAPKARKERHGLRPKSAPSRQLVVGSAMSQIQETSSSGWRRTAGVHSLFALSLGP